MKRSGEGEERGGIVREESTKKLRKGRGRRGGESYLKPAPPTPADSIIRCFGDNSLE